jgi:hypothetical protein
MFLAIVAENVLHIYRVGYNLEQGQPEALTLFHTKVKSRSSSVEHSASEPPASQATDRSRLHFGSQGKASTRLWTSYLYPRAVDELVHVELMSRVAAARLGSARLGSARLGSLPSLIDKFDNPCGSFNIHLDNNILMIHLKLFLPLMPQQEHIYMLLSAPTPSEPVSRFSLIPSLII